MLRSLSAHCAPENWTPEKMNSSFAKIAKASFFIQVVEEGEDEEEEDEA